MAFLCAHSSSSGRRSAGASPARPLTHNCHSNNH
jgi:hypothetical protein